jgi:hypothetical protein
MVDLSVWFVYTFMFGTLKVYSVSWLRVGRGLDHINVELKWPVIFRRPPEMGKKEVSIWELSGVHTLSARGWSGV